jgi:hypothetical protein
VPALDRRQRVLSALLHDAGGVSLVKNAVEP